MLDPQTQEQRWIPCGHSWYLHEAYDPWESAGEIGLQGEDAHLGAGLACFSLTPPKIHRFLNTVITGSLFSCFLPMKCVLPSCKFVPGMSWPLSCYLPLGLLRKTLHYVFFSHLPVANILTNYACRVLRVNLNTPPKTFLCISEKFLIYLNLFAIFLSHLTLAFVCLCAHMHVILALHPLYPIAPPSLLWCVTLCIGLITFCTCTPTHGALC